MRRDLNEHLYSSRLKSYIISRFSGDVICSYIKARDFVPSVSMTDKLIFHRDNFTDCKIPFYDVEKSP
jgi:hypothetical protein